LNENRWWEAYLVRYLAGNIFAVLVLFYLVINYGDKIGQKFCNSTISNNYSFCDKNSTKFSREIFAFIFQTSKEINSSNVVLLENTIGNKNYDSSDTSKVKQHTITITELNFINLIFIGLLGFLYMYISSIPIYFTHIKRGGIDNIYKFYQKLASKRDEIKKTKHYYCEEITPSYIESYKHMREHGNAFGIILMEMIFACWLIVFNFCILSIVVWLLFGFYGWFLAQYLEARMIDNKYEGVWFLILPFGILVISIVALYLFGTCPI